MKIVHTIKKLCAKWNFLFSSSNGHGEFISYNFDKIDLVVLVAFSSGLKYG